MGSRTRIASSKKLGLSLLAAAFLAGSVIAPMSADARVQQRIDIASDGTVYQYICSDAQPAGTDHDRLTNVSMSIAFNAAATVNQTVSGGTTLIARVPANPLTALAQGKRTGVLTLAACPPAVTFNATGSGSWTSGATTVSGFGGAGLTALTAASPAAHTTSSADCGSTVYGFDGGTTCSIADGVAQPTDGISLTLNQGILFVYNGSSFIPSNTAGTLNVAGGGAGFDVTAAGNVDNATGDSDTTSVTVTTTTTTTTTTTQVVPTVGNWGMMVLGLAFLGAMAWMLKARRAHLQ